MVEFTDLIEQRYPSGLYRLIAEQKHTEIEGMVVKYGYAFLHLHGESIRSQGDLYIATIKLLQIEGMPLRHNPSFDAYYDLLTGFPWPQAPGHVLLYDHFEAYYETSPCNCDIAITTAHRAAVDTDHSGKLYILLSSTNNFFPPQYDVYDEVAL